MPSSPVSMILVHSDCDRQSDPNWCSDMDSILLHIWHAPSSHRQHAIILALRTKEALCDSVFLVVSTKMPTCQDQTAKKHDVAWLAIHSLRGGTHLKSFILVHLSRPWQHGAQWGGALHWVSGWWGRWICPGNCLSTLTFSRYWKRNGKNGKQVNRPTGRGVGSSWCWDWEQWRFTRHWSGQCGLQDKGSVISSCSETVNTVWQVYLRWLKNRASIHKKHAFQLRQ